jgi:hypothetical protein
MAEPLQRFNLLTFQRGKAGCLTLMKHHIAINSDARFIALQNNCRSDNLFAAVQEGPC